MPLHHFQLPLPGFRRGFLLSRINRCAKPGDREHIRLTLPPDCPVASDPVKNRHPAPDALCGHRIVNISALHLLRPLSSCDAPHFAFRRQCLLCHPCFDGTFCDQQRVFRVFHLPHDLPGGSCVLQMEQVTDTFDRVNGVNHVQPAFAVSSSTGTPNASAIR